MADITGMLQAAAGATGQQYIALTETNSPYLRVYSWSSNGFGASYSNPSTIPPGIEGRGVAFNSTSTALAVSMVTDGLNAQAGVYVYPWSASGFGSIYLDPVTFPSTFLGNIVNGVTFHPNDDALAVVQSGGPSVAAYPWSSSGFGSKFSNPPSSINTNARGVNFHPNGDAIVIGLVTSTAPYVAAWAWSNSGFGARYLNPSTSPSVQSSINPNATFSPDGLYVVLGGTSIFTSAPMLYAYSWSSVTGFGTYYVGNTGSNSTIGGPAFSPDGLAMVVGLTTTPFVRAYVWDSSASTGTPFKSTYNNPSTLPLTQVTSVAFSKDGKYVAVGMTSAPYIYVYDWSNSSGFGARVSDPSTLPTSTVRRIAFG